MKSHILWYACMLRLSLTNRSSSSTSPLPEEALGRVSCVLTLDFWVEYYLYLSHLFLIKILLVVRKTN